MSRCLIPASIKALPARSRIGTADYCAYPVASTELEQPRATVGVGFSEG